MAGVTIVCSDIKTYSYLDNNFNDKVLTTLNLGSLRALPAFLCKKTHFLLSAPPCQTEVNMGSK